MNYHAVAKSTVTLIAIALLFAGISAFAAPDQTSDDQVFTVTGVVMDAVSHDPISGAVVSIIGYEVNTETDAEGVFRLSNISEGDQTLVIQADGYEYTELEVVVGEAEPEIEVFLYERE